MRRVFLLEFYSFCRTSCSKRSFVSNFPSFPFPLGLNSWGVAPGSTSLATDDQKTLYVCETAPARHHHLEVHANTAI